MDKIQKAERMLQIMIAQDLLAERVGRGRIQESVVFRKIKEQYQESKSKENLQRLATLLMIAKSKTETAMILAQELNLKPEEQRALEVILNSKA